MKIAPVEKKKIDYIFLTVASILVTIGIFSFFSASLGVLARNQAEFYQILLSQIGLGFLCGFIALYVCMRVPYKFWRKNAGLIMIGSLILTAMVFVPHLGFAHGGARRWISVAGISFQPVEFLKIAFIIYLC